MRLLVDMNLSPDWLPFLESAGWEACHWSAVGPGNAPDTDLMRWACDHGFVVLTQDLDFSQILFATQASGPSVVLLRIQDEFDAKTRDRIRTAIALAEPDLASGALLSISGQRIRLRRLPIDPEGNGGSGG